jgi:hypothetical protein
MKARKKEDGPKQVYISRAPRGKKKSVTVVTGLSTFGECYIRTVFSGALSAVPFVLAFLATSSQVVYLASSFVLSASCSQSVAEKVKVLECSIQEL